MTLRKMMQLLEMAGWMDKEIEKLDLVLRPEDGAKPVRFQLGFDDVAVNETNAEIELTPPSEMFKRYGSEDIVPSDMLGKFIYYLENYLNGNFYRDDREGKEYSRLAATKMKISLTAEDVCNYQDEGSPMYDPEVREIFFQELPNIIAIYEKIGWEVTFEEGAGHCGLRNGVLSFVGELPPSPYRKLLETNDVKVAADAAKLTTPEEAIEIFSEKHKAEASDELESEDDEIE